MWKGFILHHERVARLPDVLSGLLRRSRSKDVFWALRDVSFTVHGGEALGILGPNGAGKSTILGLIAQVIRSNRGTVHVIGKVAPLIASGPGFHGELTAHENIYLLGNILGVSNEHVDQAYDSIVRMTGFERFIDTPLKRFSPGMRLRLSFAIAAHATPDIFLVDDVLAAGDAAFQDLCVETLLDLKARGVAIIVVSHNVSTLERVCDRGLLLRSGRVEASGPLEELSAQYRWSNLPVGV